MSAVTSYERPAIEVPEFRDEDGHVIEYGRRWSESPPEATYSVDTHPERFAPLHTVADALVTHLRDTYDVEIDEGAETAADLLHPVPHDFARAVRIRPNNPASASLTLVFTAYPGIVMHAGLLHDFLYPVCGCDACDSSWAREADRLESQVLAVAAGNYRESADLGGESVAFSYTYPDGTSSGHSRAQDLPVDRLRAAVPVLTELSGRWAAWPHSTSD
ncbi:hypothetical protein GCM10025768_11830 [Microbacterium pseudoresistens]|uniref:Uncharacterized protein n=1 Tax=Microbacterium pseudoresistens TaxID=640634 RepID=A0A7Y9JNH0_9MICO|nr:hypothetical protein [Microbacterium pseudoresistens]